MKAILAGFMIYSQLNYGYAQTASLLPNGLQQFFDANGNPLTSGTVDFYIPSTSTRKTTWIDSTELTPNTNPVVLDAAGRAQIYGDGSYRQVLKDSLGNLIWDKVTTSTLGPGSATLVGDGQLVGTVKPWAGIIAPAQYAFAYGQELSRTTYADLYTAITQSLNIICASGSAVISGIADTQSVPVGANIESTCVPAGTTVSSKTAATITLSNPSVISTNSTGVFFPYGNGNGTTTFNVPDLRGYVLAGRDNMGGTAAARVPTTYDATGGKGGTQTHTLTIAELATHTHVLTDPGHTHTTLDALSASQTPGGGPAIYVGTNVAHNTSSATTGITIANTGSATAFSLLQPTFSLNYIIKVSTDVSNASATGVASIQGMTGILTCGANMTCTANVINSVPVAQTPAGYARMWPSSGQSIVATVPWNAKDPWDNNIDCTGTHSQCLNEFVSAATKAGWPSKVFGAGMLFPSATEPVYINSTVPFVFPVNQDWSFNSYGVNFIANLTTDSCMKFDSSGNSRIIIDGKIVCTITAPVSAPGATMNCAVMVNPTTNTQDGFPGLYAGLLYITTPVIVGSGGTAGGAVCLNTATGSTIQHELKFGEVNGTNSTAYGIIAFGPSATTALADNIITATQVHGTTVAAAQQGISATNQTNLNQNVWTIGSIQTFSGLGVETYGSRNNFKIGGINGAQGTLATGISIRAGALNEVFDYGFIGANTVADITDNGTCSTWFGANRSQIAFEGATSGCTKVIANAVASGTLTLPAATDTLVGKATTDIFTTATKTFNGTFNITGTSSGTITSNPQAAAGTYNWNWPTTVGTAGQVLNSQAGGSTAMTWTSIRQILPFGNAGTALPQASTNYVGVIASGTEAFTQFLCPLGGTFKNLYVSQTAPAAGQTSAATLRVNGADTALTCTVTGTATTCNDTTHTATCTAGQPYSLKVINSATTGAIANYAGGVEFDNP